MKVGQIWSQHNNVEHVSRQRNVLDGQRRQKIKPRISKQFTNYTVESRTMNNIQSPTWQPQDGPTSHSMESRQNILQSDENSVSHVESSGDVGRRHGQDVGLSSVRIAFFLGLFGIWLEASTGFPPLINVAFEFGRSIVSQSGLFVFEVVGARSGRFFARGGGCQAKRGRGSPKGIFRRSDFLVGEGSSSHCQRRSAEFIAVSNECGCTCCAKSTDTQGRRHAQECSSCHHLGCVPFLLRSGSFGCEQLIRHSGVGQSIESNKEYWNPPRRISWTLQKQTGQ